MRMATFFVALLATTLTSEAAQVKSRGTPGAPVQLDVYSDYQCPACKALYERTLVPLMTDYVDKGKVYLIHHEFPLAMHPHAMEAACYAVAASRVGKYEQAGDVLFRTQESWAASGNVDQTVCSILTPMEAKKVRAGERSGRDRRRAAGHSGRPQRQCVLHAHADPDTQIEAISASGRSQLRNHAPVHRPANFELACGPCS